MLLLILAGILGGTLFALIFAIGALNWMTVARLVRGQFLSLREQEFVQAGHAIGASHLRLIMLYLLPNTLSSIVVPVVSSPWNTIAPPVPAVFAKNRSSRKVLLPSKL